MDTHVLIFSRRNIFVIRIQPGMLAIYKNEIRLNRDMKFDV